MFAFPLQENTVGWRKPGNREGFWCLLCPYSELRVPGRAVLVCLWFLYLFFPCFRICFVLRFFSAVFSFNSYEGLSRRWLSPCLSYRLGAEEVRGLVSSVERLQVTQLEFKPGSLVLPSAETSSDFTIWTQNSLPEHSLQPWVLRTAIDSCIVSHLTVSLPNRCAVDSLLGCPMVCNELSLCAEGPRLPSQGIAWTWTWNLDMLHSMLGKFVLISRWISDTKFKLVSFSLKDIWNFLLIHKDSLTWRNVKKKKKTSQSLIWSQEFCFLSVVTFSSHLEILEPHFS